MRFFKLSLEPKTYGELVANADSQGDQRFCLTRVKCRFLRGDLRWSKSHVVLMQRGHGPDLKKCWCQEFQKALGLSALFSLM